MKDQQTTTSSTGKESSHSFKDPFKATLINSNELLKRGWIWYDKNALHKDGKIIRFDGELWVLGEKRVRFFEEF